MRKAGILLFATMLAALTFVSTAARKPNPKWQPVGQPLAPVAAPHQWQLRQPLRAPSMAFDPDAPVVNVAAEANLTGETDGDLDPTIDVQITQEIIDKAAELGTPLAMYEFVRDEIAFQPYYGSLKGSVHTLRSGAGNDHDQASLLIALLRSAGFAARYAEGQVEMPVDRVLSWLAVDDGDVASSILHTNGMEGISVLGLPGGTDCCVDNGTPGCDDPTIEACVCAHDSYCCDTAWDQTCADEVVSFGCGTCENTIVAVRAQRVWVEARVPRGFGGPQWVPLDPAFHQSQLQPGIDIPAEMGLDAQAFIDDYWDPSDPGVTLPRAELPVEVLEQQIQDYLDANYPGLAVDDVARTSQALSEPLGLLPNSMPYIARSRDGSFSEIPAARRYQVRFHLYNGATTLIDHTVNLPEVAGRRVTISYEGATQTDRDTITANNGLLYTPPNLIDIRPLLKIGGQTAATGAAAIGAGRTHNSDMHFLAPANGLGLPQNVVPAIFNTIVAGELQAIGLAVHGTESPLAAPIDPADTEGYIPQQRYADATDYLERVYASEVRLGELMHAAVSFDVQDAIVKDDILVTTDGGGNPTDWEWRGLTVDADRSVIGVWKVDEYQTGCGGEGTDLLVIGGAEGSAFENVIWEDDYAQEAVSTMKILQLAVDQGLTVYKRWNTLPLPANSLPASVRTALENAISMGHEVTFPEAQITYFSWTGTGYIDMDPCNGAAGYIISGGQNGGSTVDVWFDILWADPTREVDYVEGKVDSPANDSPDPGAIFCQGDTTRLRFEYQLRIHYKDGSTGPWTSRSHTSKSPSQLAPAHYVVTVGDAGPQHQRQLTIYKVVREHPTGDPTSSPAPATSEFTFSAGGMLSVQCKAKLIPADAGVQAVVEDLVKWTITDIAGSTLTWTVPWPGDPKAGKGFDTTAEFDGLPPTNAAFGGKTVTMTVDNPPTMTDTTQIEVFFRKFDNNPPNWFTYWKQALAALTGSTVDYRSIAGINGRTPAMRLWSPAMTYSKTEMWISDPSAEFNTSPYNPGRRYGIDGMADTILHEDGHIVQIGIADALVDTGNGIWEKGWSWNTGFPSPAYNHYTAGPDGQPGDAGVDDDGDGDTDETDDNSEYGFGDDVDLDTDHDNVPNDREGEDPPWVEPYCRALEVTTDNDHAAKDWGDPGKQHKTNNKHND